MSRASRARCRRSWPADSSKAAVEVPRAAVRPFRARLSLRRLRRWVSDETAHPDPSPPDSSVPGSSPTCSRAAADSDSTATIVRTRRWAKHPHQRVCEFSFDRIRPTRRTKRSSAVTTAKRFALLVRATIASIQVETASTELSLRALTHRVVDDERWPCDPTCDGTSHRFRITLTERRRSERRKVRVLQDRQELPRRSR